MKYYNLVYCKHNPKDSRAFLYQLPIDASVNPGDKLCVTDKRGEHIVTAFSGNWFSDEEFTKVLCEANSGYFPPAKVIGTVSTITFTQDIVNKFEETEEFPF